MFIGFDASREAKTALDTLMQSGEFRDISEALCIALISYEALQRGHSRGQTSVDRSVPSASSSAAAEIGRNIGDKSIPELFRLRSDSNELELRAVADVKGTIVPPSNWLFGQYNKFLPVKASCRAMLNLLSKSRSVLLTEAADSISRLAGKLGDYLVRLDDEADRPREEAFAAAFPTSGSNGSGSSMRFANQFVGDLRQPKSAQTQRRDPRLEGFPGILRFIEWPGDRPATIHLTEPGATFAGLQNPILDESAHLPTRKFSDAEIDFVLAHIKRCIPEELSAYRSIIDGISDGANTPDTLDEYLCQRFALAVGEGPGENNLITRTFLTTQRTGAISRMADLGLVAREKDGLRVKYMITESATNFRSALNRKSAPGENN